MGQVCISRYINSIANKLSSGYINAYNKDSNLVRGYQSYSCYYISQKDKILAQTNKKDELTTITSVYAELPNKEQSVLNAEEKAAKLAR